MIDGFSFSAKAKAFVDRIGVINHRIATARSQMTQIRQDIIQLAAEVDAYSIEVARANPAADRVLGPACQALREALVKLADAATIN